MKNALKLLGTLAATLTALALIPALLLALFVVAMREDTEVARIESPDGAHYAVVIASDHGATGGATYVKIEEAPKSFLFFQFTGRSQRIYSGRWGEAQTIQVVWQDNSTLLINDQPYPLPDF